ncbi:unnamed protein product [Pelagomonas calceolata]|uniref:Uncharacterized protein n=2 Tax=Pelagomonas calceolata TaxID=35677 RepID=A0A8J2WZB3_9STRA|nr:unnamed protein product [Pelagomonas calceolata]
MAPAASADETKMYHRMADWYNRPECDALRAAWGPYPATPGVLQAWPGFVAVTNAFLDSDAADDRPAVAAAAEPVAAEAVESEPVDVRPAEPAASTQPVVVSEVMEREAPAEGGAGEGVGSVEFLGRWHEKKDDRAMPVKLKYGLNIEWNDFTGARVAFGRLVEELVQKNAPSGILVIGREREGARLSWSASADDVSYQRHGLVGLEYIKHENIRFAGFEGVVDFHKGDFGAQDQMAVYRVTLPRGGLDRSKWAGRPPPLAPEDLHTGPPDDGLLSTGEISGEYSAPCEDGRCCRSKTVIPFGPDAIETFDSWVCCVPPSCIGPRANGKVLTRKPGTNDFDWMTFSADGTAGGGFKKRPHSQKRPFRKVETRDLAGTWCGCCCSPCIPLWPLSCFYWTRKKALDEDRYAESGLRCGLCPWWSICSETYTRTYHDGGGGRSYPTNGFGLEDEITCIEGGCCPIASTYYRNSGYAAGGPFFAKKVG